jgi:DNA-directed RNA polymerase specialized sigma24 family protein
MTNSDFETALEDGRKHAAKLFGEDAASLAVISALKKGPEAFESSDKLRNYMSSSARGDQRIEWIRGRHREELLRDYRRTIQPRTYRIEDSGNAWADVEKATEHLENGFRAAVITYLMESASLTEAIEYMDASIPVNTRRSRVLREVSRLLGGALSAYAK